MQLALSALALPSSNKEFFLPVLEVLTHLPLRYYTCTRKSTRVPSYNSSSGTLYVHIENKLLKLDIKMRLLWSADLVLCATADRPLAWWQGD